MRSTSPTGSESICSPCWSWQGSVSEKHRSCAMHHRRLDLLPWLKHLTASGIVQRTTFTCFDRHLPAGAHVHTHFAPLPHSAVGLFTQTSVPRWSFCMCLCIFVCESCRKGSAFGCRHSQSLVMPGAGITAVCGAGAEAQQRRTAHPLKRVEDSAGHRCLPTGKVPKDACLPWPALDSGWRPWYVL